MNIIIIKFVTKEKLIRKNVLIEYIKFQICGLKTSLEKW